MYATWEAKMLGDHNGGRGELGTTEPLGEVLYVSVIKRNIYLSFFFFNH